MNKGGRYGRHFNCFVCDIETFNEKFIPVWEQHLLHSKLKSRRRKGQLTLSEVMTIYVHFHQSHYRDFKNYYIHYVQKYLGHLFPNLVSYSRFIALIKSIIMPLCFFLQTLKGEKRGIYFVDSMLLKVCHIKREKQHKVFNEIAKKAKSSIGWFFGFKLHLIINDKGELMAFKLTAGNIDDRKVVPTLVKTLMGKLYGDKGYISKNISEKLLAQGIQLVTRVKKNMKNKLLSLADKLLLRKRAIIESVNVQLKNICQVEHTRHRSVNNFIANILAALCAYALQPNKPSLHLMRQKLLPQI